MSPRILVIDDTEHLRVMLKLTLEYKGYDVAMADNGRVGLQLAAQAGDGGAAGTAFALIFCDIEMPVMNGIEFVRRFRAEFGGATPILMLTAETGEPATQALAAGANGVIFKPFEPIELLQAVESQM